jgi:uncharacterized protein (TIGR02246 family)
MTKSSDEAAVRALYQQLMDGWNQGSGEAFAAPFAEDGDLIAFDGTHFKGRQKIAQFHQPLFEAHLKGTRLRSETQFARDDNTGAYCVLPDRLMRCATMPAGSFTRWDRMFVSSK